MIYDVYSDVTELNRIEEDKMIIKDFEVIASCKVLNIDYNKLKSTIE